MIVRFGRAPQEEGDVSIGSGSNRLALAGIVALSCLLAACGDRYCCLDGGLCSDLPTDFWFYLRWTGGIVAALLAVVYLVGGIAAAVDEEWDAVAGFGIFALVCGALAWWAYPGTTAPSTTATKKFEERCKQENKETNKKAAGTKGEVKKEKPVIRHPADQMPAVRAMGRRLRKLIGKKIELRKKYKKELGDYLAKIKSRARQSGLTSHKELLEKKEDHLKLYYLVERAGKLTHLLKWLEGKQKRDERVANSLEQQGWSLHKIVETNAAVSDKERKAVQTIMQTARAVLAESPPPLDKVQVARLEREAFLKALGAKGGHGAGKAPRPKRP